MSKLRELVASKKPGDKPTDALTKELEAESWDGLFTYNGYTDVALHEYEYRLPTDTWIEIKGHPQFRLEIDSVGTTATALELAARLAILVDQNGKPVTRYVDMYEKNLWDWETEDGPHLLMVSLSGWPETYYLRGQERTPFELFVCTKDEIEFARVLPDDHVLGEGFAPWQRLGCWLPKGRRDFLPKALAEIASKRELLIATEVNAAVSASDESADTSH